MEIYKENLKNGLKAVLVKTPGLRSVSTGVFIKTGSRFEKDSIAGVSHFLEHIVFKGTKNYESSLKISEAIESLGGEMNAATDYDMTMFYNQLPRKHFKTGLKVLEELVFSSRLRKKDIEKEKSVILEEINMYKDMPHMYVYWLLNELMGEESSLKRPIIGYKETVKGLKKEDINRYLSRFYQPANMTLVVVGGFNEREVLKEVKNVFKKSRTREEDGREDGNKGKGVSIDFDESFKPSQKEPRVKLQERKTKQAHLALGVYGFGYDDESKFAWRVLNTILGEGMSSRLFENIRDKKGWCYSISSSINSLSDTGAQIIHAGIKSEKVEEAVESILKELEKIKEESLSKKELEKAKSMIKGELDIKMDNTMALSQFFGPRELLHDKKYSPEEFKEEIDKVEEGDIKETAGKIFKNDRLNLSVIGPYNKEERFKKVLKFNK